MANPVFPEIWRLEQDLHEFYTVLCYIGSQPRLASENLYYVYMYVCMYKYMQNWITHIDICTFKRWPGVGGAEDNEGMGHLPLLTLLTLLHHQYAQVKE